MQAAQTTSRTIAVDEVPSRLNDDGKETLHYAPKMAKRFRLHGDTYVRFITTPGMDPRNY